MRYELTHDSIALQVFQKSSVEAHTRRKIERFIREHYRAHQQRGIFLDQDDLDYITPYLNAVNISAAEAEFIERSRARLRAQRRRRWTVIIAVLTCLSAAAFVAYSKSMESAQDEQARIAAERLAQEKERDAQEQKALRMEADAARQQTNLAMDTVKMARSEAEREAELARRAEAEARQFRRAAETAQQRLATANYSFMDTLLSVAKSNIVATDYGQAFGHLNTAVDFGQAARERQVEQNLPRDWSARAGTSLFDLAYYYNESGDPEWVLERLATLFPDAGGALDPLRRVRDFHNRASDLESYEETVAAIAAESNEEWRSRRILDTLERLLRAGQKNIDAIEEKEKWNLPTLAIEKLVSAERMEIKERLYKATVADVRAITPGIIANFLKREAPERFRRLAARYYPQANESFRVSGEAVGEDHDYDIAPLTAPVEVASFELFCTQTGRRVSDLATRQAHPNSAAGIVITNWRDGARYANWLSCRHGLDTLYLFDAANGITLNPAANSGYRFPTLREVEYLNDISPSGNYTVANGWCQGKLQDLHYAVSDSHFVTGQGSERYPLWLVRSGFVTARWNGVPFAIRPNIYNYYLFFDHDRPHPTDSDVTYSESVRAYYARRDEIIKDQLEPGMSQDEEFRTRELMEAFFEEDLFEGRRILLKLIEEMKSYLRAGHRLSLKMTGLTSGRGNSIYNSNLSQRRIDTIKNSLRAEGLKEYLDSGQLQLSSEVLPNRGEEETTIYPLKAARDRCVIISSVEIIL